MRIPTENLLTRKDQALSPLCGGSLHLEPRAASLFSLLLNGGQRQKSGVEGNQMFRKMDCKKKPVSYPAGFVS